MCYNMYDNSLICDVIIEADIEVLPDNCFAFSSVESVSLPNSLTRIQSGSFSFTTKLRTVEFPDSVTVMEPQIFYGAEALETFTIPMGITELNLGQFDYCSSLRAIIIPETVTMITGMYECCCPALVMHVVPDSTAERFAIENDIPYAYIGETEMFSHSEDGFTYLVKDGQAKIYEYIGEDTSIVIPTEVDGYPVTALANNLFRKSDVESIKIEAQIMKLPERCFEYSKLKTIVMPDSLTSINEFCFASSELTEIDIPDSVSYIGQNAFLGCKSIECIVIPASMYQIGESAFNLCKGLTRVVFHDNVNYIGSYAFANCSHLKSIEIPDSVDSIGVGVFDYCESLENVVLPDSFDTIPEGTFRGCSSLKVINWPAELTSIGSWAFAYCDSLESVEFPSTLRIISTRAFTDCFSLSDVNLNEGLTAIYSDTFSACKPLASIVIPSSVTMIGTDVFNFSSSPFIIYGEIGSYAEQYASEHDIIFAEIGSEAAVFTDDSGLVYSIDADNQITILTYEGEEENLTIPKEIRNLPVVKLQTKAFCNNSVLRNVIINAEVSEISEGCFYDCRSLETITLPSSVIAIKDNAFQGCGFTEIQLPDDLQKIGNFSFYNCYNLKKSISPIHYNQSEDKHSIHVLI